jgi:hypothetical protein
MSYQHEWNRHYVIKKLYVFIPLKIKLKISAIVLLVQFNILVVLH